MNKLKAYKIWYGRIKKVDETNKKKSTVYLKDVRRDKVVDFQFRNKDRLADVFRSMKSTGMPLLVQQDPPKNEVKFHATDAYQVVSLTNRERKLIVQTTSAMGNELFLRKSNPNFKKLQSKLRKSLEDQVEYWTVTKLAKRKNDPAFDYEIIDVLRRLPKIDCQARPSPHQFVEQTHKPIKTKVAQSLFRYLDGLSTPIHGPLTGIPFLYVKSGCQDRSHEMCRHILAQGIHPFKAWVYGVNGALKFSTSNAPNCKVRWAFHTAPMVSTTQGFFVLDPSVCRKAVAVQDWYRKFAPRHIRVYCSTHHTYTLNSSLCQYDSDPEYRHAERNLAILRNKLRCQVAEYGPPPY